MPRYLRQENSIKFYRILWHTQTKDKQAKTLIFITLHFIKMENDMQLMCMMAKEMLLILRNKRENKLKNELTNPEKVKAIMFTFMVKATES